MARALSRACICPWRSLDSNSRSSPAAGVRPPRRPPSPPASPSPPRAGRRRTPGGPRAGARARTRTRPSASPPTTQVHGAAGCFAAHAGRPRQGLRRRSGRGYAESAWRSCAGRAAHPRLHFVHRGAACWRTPKRCCSSTTHTASRANSTSCSIRAWVPTIRPVSRPRRAGPASPRGRLGGAREERERDRRIREQSIERLGACPAASRSAPSGPPDNRTRSRAASRRGDDGLAGADRPIKRRCIGRPRLGRRRSPRRRDAARR